LDGVDELVLSLTAKGLTTGRSPRILAEVYGAEVSRDTISNITDRVLGEMADWQSRPLDPIYPVLFIDAIHVKIRDAKVANRPTPRSRSAPKVSGTCWGCGPVTAARAPSSHSGSMTSGIGLGGWFRRHGG